MECTYCGNELKNWEADPEPDRDSDGYVMCSECYREHYMDNCCRCCELVEKEDLDASPGNVVIVLEDAPATPEDLAPGYYRVKGWPFFVSYMIGGHFYADQLERVADLDESGQRAAKEAWTAAAPLCSDCRVKVEALVTANVEHNRRELASVRVDGPVGPHSE